ncbi:hypothetical protein Daus18300_012488 [Diaporthe australafricana]|uniref:VWFA domain-containing protein n=1 Tax=Diaporthe australafricana TaxID=127596 RepID=A0ABR3W2P5_9PEZI
MSRVVRVAPMPSVGSSAKDHVVPEKTAHAPDEVFDLKARLRRLAKKLVSTKNTDGDDKLRAQNSATIQHTQAVTHAISEELYKTALPLPGSKTRKMVYPLAPVESSMFTMSEYEDQFEVVKDKLKEIVDKDEVLRLRGRFIVYSLRMVGTTPQSAVPTIVVGCMFKDQKNIRAAFKRHSTDNFYCHHESKRLQKSISGLTHIPPPFRLVYWGDNRDPCERSASEMELKASLSRDSTFCGSLVTFQGHSATLALTLEVDSADIVLTAGHLQSRQHVSEPSASWVPECSDSDEITLNGEDYVEIGPLWVDDDDDYEVEAATLQPIPPQPHLLSYSSPAYSDNRAVPPLQKMRPVQLPADIGPNAPDLDWMPLECDDSTLRARRRNFICPPEQPKPVLLKEVATKPRMHAVPVFVISGVRGVITGRMLGMPTFIGSKPGQTLSKAWSLVLDDQLVVLAGESGSVVVDQETFSVYGHVIGSDRLGHALIIPLCDTIQQITSAFNANSTCSDESPRTPHVALKPENILVYKTKDGPKFNLATDGRNSLQVAVQPPTHALEAECREKARQKGDFFVPALLTISKQMLKPPQQRPNALQVHRGLVEALSKAASEPREELSVGEILEWIHEHKTSHLRRMFVGFINPNNRTLGRVGPASVVAALSGMKDREHIFLVDDSSSIQRHAEEVKKTFRALAYMAKSADPNGYQLCFTSSPEQQTWYRHTTPGVCAIQKRMFGRTGGNTETPEIPSRHQRRSWGIEKAVDRFLDDYGSVRPRSNARPTTIFVLTDGKWDFCLDWQERLEQNVASLSKNFPHGHISIRFIQFSEPIAYRYMLSRQMETFCEWASYPLFVIHYMQDFE